MRTAEQHEIRSGIAEDELVIAGRHAGLQSGQKVKARMMQASLQGQADRP